MFDAAHRRIHFRHIVGDVLRDSTKTIEVGMLDALEAAYQAGVESITGRPPRPPVELKDDRGEVTRPAPIAGPAAEVAADVEVRQRDFFDGFKK